MGMRFLQSLQALEHAVEDRPFVRNHLGATIRWITLKMAGSASTISKLSAIVVYRVALEPWNAGPYKNHEGPNLASQHSNCCIVHPNGRTKLSYSGAEAPIVCRDTCPNLIVY